MTSGCVYDDKCHQTGDGCLCVVGYSVIANYSMDGRRVTLCST